MPPSRYSVRSLSVLVALCIPWPTMAAEPTNELLLTPARSSTLLDPRIEPTALVRLGAVHTFSHVQSVDVNGQLVQLNSADADRSAFGHRGGFVLDTMQLGLKGRFNDVGFYYEARLDMMPRHKDGLTSSDYLSDAFFGWDRFSVVDLRAGRMKLPLSRANLTPAASRMLLLNPTLDTLIPDRQLGLRVDAGDPWGVGRLIFGVYTPTTNLSEQAGDFDSSLFAGRVELRVDKLLETLALAPTGFEFELELSGSFGWAAGYLGTQVEHRWLGGDVRLKLWRFLVTAELIFKDFYLPPLPTDKSRPQRGWGWHVDLSFVVVPKWLDVVARVEQSDGDSAQRGAQGLLTTVELSRRNMRWVTAGLTAHFTRHATLVVQYTHRQELEGTQWDNDVFAVLLQGRL